MPLSSKNIRLAILSCALLILLMTILKDLHSSRFLQSSLLDDRVFELLDTDQDHRLTVREMRHGINAMVRAMGTQDLDYDFDSSSTVSREDLRILVRIIRGFLTAVCGNGAIDSGEKCDDQNTNSGDGCSETCRVETGYSCSGTPSNCSVTNPGIPTLLDGLDVYWKFDENGGTRFPSVGDFALTQSAGTTSASESGKINRSAVVNPGSELSNTDDVLPNANRDFTVAGWIKPRGTALGVYIFGLTGNVSSWSLDYDVGPDQPGFYFVVGDKILASKNFGSIEEGNWYFVVATFIADTRQLFLSVNAGTPDTAVLAGAPPDNSDAGRNRLIIANHAGNTSHFELDELGIWSRVLTPEEISALYNDAAGRTLPPCGDGIKQGTEECDDGNTNDVDFCSNTCKLPVCGDGVKNGDEQCDDANTSNEDSCTNSCKDAVCGDTFKQGDEECDDGNDNNEDSCTNSCKNAVCGDGFRQGDEQCDDGNDNNSDDCTNSCKNAVCRDGFQQGSEECDDGNDNNEDSCTNSCKNAFCGDGFRQGDEQCDDGNDNNEDDCTKSCRNAVCGDSFRQGNEECDDGNDNNDDSCRNDCTLNQ